MTAEELQSRLKSLAYRIVPLCESLPATKVSKIIEGQLLRSVFSAAANYRPASKVQSEKAFKAKLSIAFDEIDETLFWLEVINDLRLLKNEQMTLVIREANELTRILAATRKKLNKKTLINLKYSILNIT